MNRREKLAYLMGMVVGLFLPILLAALLFELQPRYRETLSRLNYVWFGRGTWGIATRSLPDSDTLSALNDVKATYDNMRNITDHGRGGLQASFVVEWHAERSYALRPNMKVGAHFLEPKQMSFDLPVLYVNETVPHPARVAAYLRREASLSYTLSSDSKGYRTTLPIVETARKVLVVGDSVAFGLGVSDEQTIASHLQTMLGKDMQVVNAGLSGYGTPQIMAVVEGHKNQGFEDLVYILCTNDFARGGGDLEGLESDVADVVAGLRPYLNYYARITVFLHQYIEDIDPTMFPNSVDGVTPERVRERNARLSSGRTIGNGQAEIGFINWYDIALPYRNEQETVFGYFGLYADHCHFSPKGNSLAAQAILSKLARRPDRRT